MYVRWTCQNCQHDEEGNMPSRETAATYHPLSWVLVRVRPVEEYWFCSTSCVEEWIRKENAHP